MMSFTLNLYNKFYEAKSSIINKIKESIYVLLNVSSINKKFDKILD